MKFIEKKIKGEIRLDVIYLENENKIENEKEKKEEEEEEWEIITLTFPKKSKK